MSTVLTDTSQLVETILMGLIPLGYKTSVIIYIMRTLWDGHPQQVLIASFESIPIQHQLMRLTKV